jgi:hypothetical protein
MPDSKPNNPAGSERIAAMTPRQITRRGLLTLAGAFAAYGTLRRAALYADTTDLGPLSKTAATGQWTVTDHEETWQDGTRVRDVPVRLHVPSNGPSAAKGTILFSHGLGGNLDSGGVWTKHWASWGYLTVNVQHPGSDESIWRGKLGQGKTLMQLMTAEATAEQDIARFVDIKFVIDQLLARAASDAILAQMNLTNIGMSGHSFGALTTLGVAGESFPVNGVYSAAAREKRIIAAIAMSPDVTGLPDTWPSSYGSIQIPFMSLTGTQDGDVIGNGATPDRRKKPYLNMAPGEKFLLVLSGVNHMFYNNPESNGLRILKVMTGTPQEEQIVKGLSVEFWDAFLTQNSSAHDILHNVQPINALVAPGSYSVR